MTQASPGSKAVRDSARCAWSSGPILDSRSQQKQFPAALGLFTWFCFSLGTALCMSRGTSFLLCRGLWGAPKPFVNKLLMELRWKNPLRAVTPSSTKHFQPVSLAAPAAAATAGHASGSSKVVALELRVPPLQQALRLDECLLQLLPGQFPSLTRAKRSVRRREVLVDGVHATTDTELQGGELIQWLQHKQAREAKASDLQAPGTLPRVQVVWEDDHLACVVKPQGMPMERGHGSCITLSHCLPYVLVPSMVVGAMRFPHYAHRLDEPTGGLVLVGKSWAAMRALGEAFEGRRITKRYRALAWGRLEGHGLVRYTLDGKPSETEYVVVGHSRVTLDRRTNGSSSHSREGSHGGRDVGCGGSSGGGGAVDASDAREGTDSEYSVGDCVGSGGAAAAEGMQWVTTVDLYPHTGRTHQLRRHMALIGHPLVGDYKYTHGYAKQRCELGGGKLDPGCHVQLPAGGGDRGASGAVAAAADAGQSGRQQQQEEEEEVFAAKQAGGLEGKLNQEPAATPKEAATAAATARPVVAAAAPIWVVACPEAASAPAATAGVAAGEAPARSSDGKAAKRARQAAVTGYAAPVLCLWAVQLDLQHPVTDALLHLELVEPQIYSFIRQELGGGGNK